MGHYYRISKYFYFLFISSQLVESKEKRCADEAGMIDPVVIKTHLRCSHLLLDFCLYFYWLDIPK